MDKEKVKLIIRNLELLIDSLKVEVYSDTTSYSHNQQNVRKKSILDYDEVFEEEVY